MAKKTPFVHLFRTPGGYYIFDVNTNTIIKTKKETYDLLKMSEKEELSYEDNRIKPFIDKMSQEGYFSSNRVKKVLHPATKYLDDYLKTKLQMICLQVTQNCNLRCEYCVYSDKYVNRSHSNAQMSFEVAKRAIDFLIERSIDVETVNISFYGGEPILEFELIKKCIDYAISEAEGKLVTFSLTTNGTLFTKEIIEFFQQHDVQITISLDGPKAIHDKNRKFAGSGCGTFDKVSENLKFFKDHYEKYFDEKVSFNVVLDSKSDFACVNSFFTSYDVIKQSIVITSYISDHYAKFEIDSNEENDIKTNYELFKLYLSNFNRIDNKYVSKLVQHHYEHINTNLSKNRGKTTLLNEEAHHGGPCIPGVLRLFVDVNGMFFPCERVDENSEAMKIGNIYDGYNIDKIKNLLNIGQITSESCIDCWAFNFCTICAALADDNGKLSASKKLSKCDEVRYSLEQNLIDYCILREFGHTFEDSKFFMTEA